MSLERLNRRTFLRGAGGVALALPWLESMAVAAEPAMAPRRMVCIGTHLGFVPGEFFPQTAGADFTAPRLLQPLEHLRNDYTVFSGLDHGVNGRGGHLGTHAFLSGIVGGNAKAYTNRNVSVDQIAAEHVGAGTRYPSLQLSPQTDKSWKMSWSRAGVGLVPIESLDKTFDLLFKQRDAAQVSAERDQIAATQSILDVVNGEAKALSGKVGASDRERLDQYLTSVRELETRLVQSEQWLNIPKPQTSLSLPKASDQLPYTKRLELFYDLMVLALQTDSTRVISLELSDLGPDSGLNLNAGYHTLSHHGKVPEALAELHKIEIFHMQQFARFLDKLGAVTEPDGSTLLDSTMSLIGSGLGNAASHSNSNLPLLLAGGGFRHGNHYAVPENKQGSDAALATNLYLTMLQRFGVETDTFNTSKNTLAGFEVA